MLFPHPRMLVVVGLVVEGTKICLRSGLNISLDRCAIATTGQGGTQHHRCAVGSNLDRLLLALGPLAASPMLE